MDGATRTSYLGAKMPKKMDKVRALLPWSRKMEAKTTNKNDQMQKSTVVTIEVG
jgi:hypothetical protein